MGCVLACVWNGLLKHLGKPYCAPLPREKGRESEWRQCGLLCPGLFIEYARPAVIGDAGGNSMSTTTVLETMTTGKVSQHMYCGL